ncbi:hypothetical protein M3J09_010452 [Ascochyta lentis]
MFPFHVIQRIFFFNSFLVRQRLYVGFIDLARRFGGSTSGCPLIKGRQSRNGRPLLPGVICNSTKAKRVYAELFQSRHGLFTTARRFASFFLSTLAFRFSV